MIDHDVIDHHAVATSVKYMSIITRRYYGHRDCKSRLDSARNHVKQALPVTSHFWLCLLRSHRNVILWVMHMIYGISQLSVTFS